MRCERVLRVLKSKSVVVLVVLKLLEVNGIGEGRVPLHTLRADIDYATYEALTTYGILGIKVWIFKGEVVDTPAVAEQSAGTLIEFRIRVKTDVTT